MQSTELMPVMNKKQIIAAFATAAVAALSIVPFASAQSVSDDARGLWSNPIVKQGAIGAGIGAITGGVSDRSSIGRGAAAGALTGVGTGVVDSSTTMQRKPMLRRTAKGAIIGVGAGAATNRSKTKGAILGAGAGAAYHLIKDGLD